MDVWVCLAQAGRQGENSGQQSQGPREWICSGSRLLSREVVINQ